MKVGKFLNLNVAILVFLTVSVRSDLSPARAGLFSSLFGNKPTPILYVIWVDQSQSRHAEDLSNFEQVFSEKLSKTNPGDRVVVGAIGAHTLTEFRAIVDVEFAKTGSSYKDKKNAKNVREDLLARFSKFIEGDPKDTKTNILEALYISYELIAADQKRTRVEVILLSDMIEDSWILNMEKETLTDERTNAVIDQLRANGLFPDLTDVAISVSGAKARNSQKYAEVKIFWFRIFEETGAVWKPGMYVRSGVPLDHQWNFEVRK